MSPRKKSSPEAHFIRTGEIRPGFDRKKALRLGARFLSRTWYESAKRKKLPLPLPSFQERIHGGQLGLREMQEIDFQLNFVLKAFQPFMKLSQKRLASVSRQIKKKIGGRASIKMLFGAHSEKKILQIRKEGIDNYNYLKENGFLCRGYIQSYSGRTFFAKSFHKDFEGVSTPMHEAIHALQQMGAIKIDVPFAEAIDRLYSLENCYLTKQKMASLEPADFDWTPKMINPEKRIFQEPEKSYSIGRRLGQWVFENLPKEKRWKYFFLRCNGHTHAEALKNC